MKELTVKIDVKAVKSEELYLMSHQVAHLEDRTYYPNDESKYDDEYNPFGTVLHPKASVKFRKKYEKAYTVENIFLPVEEALIEKGFIVERLINLSQVENGKTIPFYLGKAYIFTPKVK